MTSDEYCQKFLDFGTVCFPIQNSIIRCFLSPPPPAIFGDENFWQITSISCQPPKKISIRVKCFFHHCIYIQNTSSRNVHSLLEKTTSSASFSLKHVKTEHLKYVLSSRFFGKSSLNVVIRDEKMSVTHQVRCGSPLRPIPPLLDLNFSRAERFAKSL